jgi:hypothetical protein
MPEKALVSVSTLDGGQATIVVTNGYQKQQTFHGSVTDELIQGTMQSEIETVQLSINRYTGEYVARQNYRDVPQMGIFYTFGTCHAAAKPKL